MTYTYTRSKQVACDIHRPAAVAKKEREFETERELWRKKVSEFFCRRFALVDLENGHGGGYVMYRDYLAGHKKYVSDVRSAASSLFV